MHSRDWRPQCRAKAFNERSAPNEESSRIQIHPVGVALRKLLQKLLRAWIGQLAFPVEQLGCAAYIRFGLLHGRNIQKHERLAQMMIRAETADRTRRH